MNKTHVSLYLNIFKRMAFKCLICLLRAQVQLQGRAHDQRHHGLLSFSFVDIPCYQKISKIIKNIKKWPSTTLESRPKFSIVYVLINNLTAVSFPETDFFFRILNRNFHGTMEAAHSCHRSGNHAKVGHSISGRNLAVFGPWAKFECSQNVQASQSFLGKLLARKWWSHVLYSTF